MHARAALVSLFWAAVAVSGPSAIAQQATVAAPAPLPPRADEPPARREPIVLHHTIEDGGSKIDELVVRGELQHVVVTPKVGTTKSYEIIVPRGGRTPPDSTGGATSAVGKRVWNVLAF